MFHMMCLSADFSMFVSIVDDSLTSPFDKLKCMLFAPMHQSLPDAEVGDIIRFHRLKVNASVIIMIIICFSLQAGDCQYFHRYEMLLAVMQICVKVLTC